MDRKCAKKDNFDSNQGNYGIFCRIEVCNIALLHFHTQYNNIIMIFFIHPNYSSTRGGFNVLISLISDKYDSDTTNGMVMNCLSNLLSVVFWL